MATFEAEYELMAAMKVPVVDVDRNRMVLTLPQAIAEGSAGRLMCVPPEPEPKAYVKLASGG